MKYKVGDYVTRRKKDYYSPLPNIGIDKDHEITAIRKFSLDTIFDENVPSSYYYMLKEVTNGNIHSAWEDQLELSVIYNSPLGRALL